MDDYDNMAKPIPEIKNMGKLSIDELDKLFDEENGWGDSSIEILPNGEIVKKDSNKGRILKPLTMRENLGGEYGRMDEASLCGVRDGN